MNNKGIISIQKANWLYLASMVLVVVVGSTAQAWSRAWGLLFTELALILAPALVLARWGRFPLPWGKISLSVGILSFFLGSGVWLVGVSLDQLMAQLLPYASVATPSLVSSTWLDTILMALGLAVAAPFCEEILFRGVIQSAWSARGARVAWLATTALFIFFHLRLRGLPALIPVALLLGWVMMRGRSLWAGILMHAGNNGMVAFALIAMMFTPAAQSGATAPAAGAQAWIGILTTGVLGLAISIPLWFALNKRLSALAAANEPQTGEAPQTESSPLPRMAWMPLALAGLIYVGLGGYELLAGLNPQAAGLTAPLAFSQPAWPERQTLNYEIRNPFGEAVGSAECAFEGALARCSEQVTAFKVEQGNSSWQSGAYTREFEARWNAEDGALEAFRLKFTGEGGGERTLTAAPGPDGLLVRAEDSAGTHNLTAAKGDLVEQEWMFRLSGLAFPFEKPATTRYANMWKFNPNTNSNVPVLDDVTLTSVKETTRLAGGEEVCAWKVTGMTETAWYACDAPHTLLRWEEPALVYVMKGSQ